MMSSTQNEKKTNLWEKFNSNLAILILGSVITGLLIPIFQNNQKKLEWKRQIKYGELSFQIETVRECMEEFMIAAAFTVESKERILPFMDKDNISESEYIEFKEEFLKMQNLRFRQNVKLASLVFYFDNKHKIQELIDEYTLYSSKYIRNCEEYVRLKYCNSHPAKCQENYESKTYDLAHQILTDKLSDFTNIQNSFNDVLKSLQKEIEFIQQENLDFNF